VKTKNGASLSHLHNCNMEEAESESQEVQTQRME
jgi:hypothetical protein